MKAVAMCCGKTGAVGRSSAEPVQNAVSVEEQVRHELTKPGCERIVARLDTETGAVAAFADPTPHLARQAVEDLPTLRAEAKKLQAIIDNPATPQIERTKAAQRLSAVTVLIEGIEAATHPVSTVGMTRPTIRYERDAHGYIVGATKA